MLALVCAMIGNVAQAFAGGKGQTKSFSPEDFIPKWGVGAEEDEKRPSQQSKAQSVDEMKRLFKQLAAEGAVKKRKPKRGNLNERT